MNHSICGWTGSTQSRNDLATTLGRMCRHLSLQDGSQCHIHTEDMTGIAIAGPPADLLKSADERIVEFLSAESDRFAEHHELDVTPLMDRRTLPDRRTNS